MAQMLVLWWVGSRLSSYDQGTYTRGATSLYRSEPEELIFIDEFGFPIRIVLIVNVHHPGISCTHSSQIGINTRLCYPY